MDEGKIIAAIFSRLQSDTTLRSLLGKTAFPWGVFREEEITKEPDLPMITLEFFQGILRDYTDRENGHLIMNVRVYSKNNIEEIQARVRRLLRTNIRPITIADTRIHSFRHTHKGQENWIDGLRIPFRMDTYQIHYTMYDEVG